VKLSTLLLVALVAAVLAAAVRAPDSSSHPSAYCGKGLNVTGNYAVSFVRQFWRADKGGGASLIRVYRHYERIGDTSQFRFTHMRKKVCGGIL
jgi:hypothetical protein